MKNVNKRLRNQRIIALAVLLIAVALIISFCSVKSDMSGSQDESAGIMINITSDITVREITDMLEEKNIIKYPSVFRMYLKLTGQDSDIKAGLHTVSESMSYKQLSDELTGDASVDAVAITIPEGYEFDMIAEVFAEKAGIDYDRFCELAQTYEFDYDFIDMIPDRPFSLEGYLFPDTYYITENDDELAILNMMLKRFSQHYDEKFKSRAAELGMTADQIVTLASIIQREAGNTEEMADVSSVFHNRLKSDEYPYLQSCATVQYILDERKPVLSNEDTQIESPYNTYINKGLPLGPIASPGADALEAALYPSDTNYYFFVAGEDGKSIFSETFEEHIGAAY